MLETVEFDDPALANQLFGPHNAHLELLAAASGASISSRGASVLIESPDMKGIFSEGQLDESELTFKDLHFLSENFQRILTGIFHQRIAYPDARIRDAAKPEGKPAAKNGAGAPHGYPPG